MVITARTQRYRVFIFVYTLYLFVLILLNCKLSKVLKITNSSNYKFSAFLTCERLFENLTSPVRFKAIIIAGISTSCKIIPGIALKKAPAKNIFRVNLFSPIPSSKVWSIPHTPRPNSIAIIMERYNAKTHFQCECEYKNPTAKP